MLRKRPTISSAASDEVWLLKSRVRRIEKPRLGRPARTAGKFHFEPSLWFTSIDHLVGTAGSGLYVFAPAGRRTVNTEPLPSSLVTVTSPPIMRASLRVMA